MFTTATADEVVTTTEAELKAYGRLLKRMSFGQPQDPTGQLAMSGPCWLSGYALQTDGYSQVRITGKLVYCHRLSFAVARSVSVADIPVLDSTGKRLVIDHLCRNRHCFQPAHLELVGESENIRRSWNSRRRADAWHSARKIDRIPMSLIAAMREVAA